MTDLPELALAFCRECMGHKDASLGSSNNEPRIFFRGNLASRVFDFTDLNAVMAAARVWCRANFAYLNIRFMYGIDHYKCEVITPTLSAAALGDELSEPLMAACLEAQRKLAEATCT